MEYFNGLHLAFLVGTIILGTSIPHFIQKDREDYHLQHTAASSCPDCKDKP